MSTRALVVGSGRRAADVAEALEARDIAVRVLEDPQRVGVECAGEQLDHYVQLPIPVTSQGATVVSRLRDFLDGGLLRRYDEAAAVLPMLRERATVLLVAGHSPAGLDAPDDRRARWALLRVLAHAVRADGAGSQTRVHAVDSDASAEVIAEAARTGLYQKPDPVAAPFQETGALSYADWRTEVLGLASTES